MQKSKVTSAPMLQQIDPKHPKLQLRVQATKYGWCHCQQDHETVWGLSSNFENKRMRTQHYKRNSKVLNTKQLSGKTNLGLCIGSWAPILPSLMRISWMVHLWLLHIWSVTRKTINIPIISVDLDRILYQSWVKRSFFSKTDEQRHYHKKATIIRKH